MEKIFLFLLAFNASIVLPTAAQTDNAPHRPDPDLLHFFMGYWKGEGEFANGKKVAADVSFQLSLDSCWLVYTHRDKLPDSYKADAYWGVDRQTGEFLAYCFDNFQGHRQFVSNGWKNGRLILTAHAYLSQVGNYFEHFIYEKLSDSSFKMSYETSRDGIQWKLGDWLVFRKTEG
ncbi:MAG TPA: hypothetical protein VF939_08685 [Puia sp.]